MDEELKIGCTWWIIGFFCGIAFLIAVGMYQINQLPYQKLQCETQLHEIGAQGYFSTESRICYVEYEEGRFMDLLKYDPLECFDR